MKRLYTFFIIILVFFVFIVLAAPIFAESNFLTGLKTTAVDGAGYPAEQASDSVNFLARMLGNALTPMFMGVICMLSLSYGGYKWMMARGNEQDVVLAKTIIINTIIATVVAFSAYAIVNIINILLVNKTLGK